MKIILVVISISISMISQSQNTDFTKISLTRQKKLINSAFKQFYLICESDSTIAKTDSANGKLITYYEPIWQLDYDTSFSPILEYFPAYYKKSRDTVTLLNFFKTVNCHTDGGFGEQFHWALQFCYFLDKKTFARQVKKIKSRLTRYYIVEGLLTGIQSGYKVGANNRQRIVDKEKRVAMALLKK